MGEGGPCLIRCIKWSSNSPLTPQELDMIMSEITCHIVPGSPEFGETKIQGVYLYFVYFSGGRPCRRCRGKKNRRKRCWNFNFKLFNYKFILVYFSIL